MPGSGYAVVLLSGGLDSMTAAARAREDGFGLLALTIDYNQRHRVEIDAAGRIAKMLGAERHIVLPLDLRSFGGSALTDDIAVPKQGVGPGIPVTYVPARNTIAFTLQPSGFHLRLEPRLARDGRFSISNRKVTHPCLTL